MVRMTERVTAYIGLGSNLGDRERSIRESLRLLGGNGSIEVARVSDLQETAPLLEPTERRAGDEGLLIEDC